jgi:hypothetical protein
MPNALRFSTSSAIAVGARFRQNGVGDKNGAKVTGAHHQTVKIRGWRRLRTRCRAASENANLRPGWVFGRPLQQDTAGERRA